MLLVVLGAAALAIWVFEVAVPGHREEVDRGNAELISRQADRFAAALFAAGRDGTLTDAEIGAADGAPRQWTARRGGGEVAVVARFLAGDQAECRSFTLTLPTRPGTPVRADPLPECPEDLRTAALID